MTDKPIAWGMPRPDGTIIDCITPEEHAREPGQYTVPLCKCQPKAEHRPPNCGTGFCSCIECPYVQPKAEQEPFGYFKPEPFGWTDCGEDDEGAIALYAAPQPRRQPPPSGR
jgi:hypothetical protein